jgi:tRNA threonylcarbamoyladenosine biosynthesis protein TsaB
VDQHRPLVLAIESATAQLSVALVRGGETLVERSPDSPGHHAERVLPLIEAVFAEAELGVDDPDAWAVSIGPGSFTSLRVGLATAKGLAFGSERPIVAVPTLEALAWGATLALEPKASSTETPSSSHWPSHSPSSSPSSSPMAVPVAALLDARRGEIYAAVFGCESEGRALRPLVKDGLFSPEELAPLLPAGCRLVGEGALLYGTALQDLAEVELLLPAAQDPAELAPRASWIGRLAVERLARGELADENLAPRYVRRAEAEVTRTSLAVEDPI